ncbi:zinc finger protein 569 [Bactrocera oleae]|uniref:zinc finger protein 569 n=1 Tax=Bactrocera oleae TaxID=104688 RepID=UPI0006B78621|nr:zinc finger protein 239 [Bactrocera oleae]XP_036212811.1 zinc finger protein 239 [Bactrocera oleae]
MDSIHFNMSAADEFEEPAPTPTYNCKRCKKTFSCKRDQLLHKKEVHFQAKSSYECKLCSKFFCNGGNLERHMKVHNDVRPFVCHICEKAFAQAVNLQRHFSVHNGERPYQCNFCTKSFTQQSNMHRHQLTHTGEKPFRCKRCGRYFSQRVNLKKHIMGHLNAKPYACGICQKSFIQLSNFKKHLQSHVKEGVEVDIASTVAAATAAARQSIELASQPVAFECAICRSIYDNFADFEMHESACTGAVQPKVETLDTNTSVDMYSPMKFEVAHLDTHEIIIETTR